MRLKKNCLHLQLIAHFQHKNELLCWANRVAAAATAAAKISNSSNQKQSVSMKTNYLGCETFNLVSVLKKSEEKTNEEMDVSIHQRGKRLNTKCFRHTSCVYKRKSDNFGAICLNNDNRIANCFQIMANPSFTADIVSALMFASNSAIIIFLCVCAV